MNNNELANKKNTNYYISNNLIIFHNNIILCSIGYCLYIKNNVFVHYLNLLKKINYSYCKLL